MKDFSYKSTPERNEKVISGEVERYPEKITLETKLEEVYLSVRSHKQLSRLGIRTYCWVGRL